MIMTMRKPKPNLLYGTEASTPWQQLAVVTTQPDISGEQHAAHWRQALRLQDSSLRDLKGLRRH